MSYIANLAKIFVSSAVINNIILIQFLGLCSYIGLTNELSSATGMSFAVIFVTVASSILAWIIDNWILIPTGLQPALQITTFILVIGSFVGLVEIYLKKQFQICIERWEFTYLLFQQTVLSLVLPL